MKIEAMPGKQTILFVSYTAQHTGPTQSLLLLLNGLRAHYDVAVLVPGTGWLTEELEALGIRQTSVPRITKATLLQIAAVVRRENAQLVYANTHDRTARIAHIAARMGGAGFICHVRGMGSGASRSRFGHLRFADAVIAVSEAAAAAVKHGVAADRLHVVHNGVAVAGLEDFPARNLLRAELGWEANRPVILAVGNVSRRKGQHFAVRAMKRVREELPDAHLYVAGRLEREPDYVEELRDEISHAGLESHVTLLGFRPDALRLMSAADALVHTALADPHPRAVIEAMSVRLPVAAFDVDGVSETVVDGVTGVLVPRGATLDLASALVTLLKAPDTRSRMGEAGRELVIDRFSEQTTANGVREIIRRMLDRPPGVATSGAST